MKLIVASYINKCNCDAVGVIRVNVVYFVLAKLIHCYFPRANLIDRNVRATLVDNDMY